MTIQHSRLMIILALALLLGTAPPTAAAAPGDLERPADSPTIVVDTTLDSLAVDGLCSLREAITAVNTHAVVDTCGMVGGFDLITLPAGTYTLAIPGSGEDDDATGDFDIRGDVTIEGIGPEETIIDGAGLDRLLHVHAGAHVRISGITLQNGVAASHRLDGGGILNQGSLTVEASIVRNNLAGTSNSCGYHGGSGGGIASSDSLIVVRSKVMENRAGSGGDCGFGYYADPGNGGDGGGIFASGSALITDSQITGNASGDAGSGQSRSSICGIHYCGFVIGRDGGSGGGIYSSGSLQIVDSSITANVTGHGSDVSGPWAQGGAGGHGGGLVAMGGRVNVRNSTFSGNLTGREGHVSCFACISMGQGTGGGIAAQGGSILNISHSTIVNNDRYGISPYDGPTVRLRDTILAGNTGGDCSGRYWYTGTLTLAGHNLVQDVASCTVTGDPAGTLMDIPPQLEPLNNNGGNTLTHALAPGSPAIDAGICTDIEGAPVITDQRGFPRPSGSSCDIGAFEVQQPTIDIKPGEPDNVIDLSERGKIAVAVLSSEGFDAPNDLMRGAFTFGRTGAEKSLLYRKGNAPYCSTRDVNADGLPDLVCQFLVKLTGFQVGDTEGVLVGMTTAGGPFEGRDRVQVVP